MKKPKKEKAPRTVNVAAPISQPQPAPIVMLTDPMGAPAEAIGSLRTRIQSQHIQMGRRALAICSASSNVGNTFVAVNLAVALAQIGIKTLLIDGNLRDPTMQNYFTVEDKTGGLQNCLLSDDSSVADYTNEDVLPNLDVIFAGTPTARAQELIASDRFPALINSCLRDYEMTIADTPAANRCADGLRISSVLGFSLIVARKNRTMVSDVRTLADQLMKERVVVAGTVLNAY
jgi:capsular exopolysaccharide synthesis family protein